MLLIGCKKNADVNNNLRENGNVVNYFPDKIFNERDDLNAFTDEWYSKQLSALEEPSIYEQRNDDSQQVFRFTWLRTFHHPVSIRLRIRKDGTGLLYVKMTDGAGGYEPGRIKKNLMKDIDEESVKSFQKLLNNEGFWKLPSIQEVIGCDGAQWIIEGLSNRRYHLVDRWSPEEGGVRKIGLHLLDLSGLPIPVEDIY